MSASAPIGTARGSPRVYLHLDHGRSPGSWSAAYQKGQVFEPRPYGYHWAEPWVTLHYSADAQETSVMNRLRRGLKILIGFDLIHAFRNRGRARGCDVI